MSKTFPLFFSDVSFSSTFFWFYRVFGCFSAIRVKKHHKTFCIKLVSKSLHKKLDKNLKPIFFSIFFSRFWAFLGEGSSKTRQKDIEKINPTLVLFWPLSCLTHPSTTGATDFFWAGPPLGLGFGFSFSCVSAVPQRERLDLLRPRRKLVARPSSNF
jgi:hypothetical protein